MADQKGSKKVRRVLGVRYNVFVLGLVSFFTDLSTEMIVPILPIFLVNELGATFAFVGLIEGLADGAKEVFRVPSGILSDRIRKRKLLVGLGYTLSALTKPLIAISILGGQVLGLRFLDRVGKGLRDAPRDALIGDSVGAGERGRSFGFHRTLDTMGAVAGALITIALISLLGFSNREVFLVAGLGGLVSVLLIFLFVKEPKPKNGKLLVPWKTIFKLPKVFWWFVLAAFIFSLGQFGAAFLVLRFDTFGFALAFLPAIFIVFNIVHAGLSTPIGILSDRIGRKTPLIVGWLVFALLSLVLALSQQLWLLWFVIIAYGVFLAFSDGIARAFITDLVRPQHRGTALGIFGLAVGIGILIANLVVGKILDSSLPLYAFSYPVITSLIAVLVLVLIKNGHIKKTSSLNSQLQ